MFSLPFQYQPHAVFKPDDFSRSTDGLGTLQNSTGRGIFRPGGYGGGIFDQNIAGLGYTAESLPWLTYSADTVEFQKDLNVLLRAAGKATIPEDGKMGPGTCDVCRELDACRPIPTSCSNQYAAAPAAPVTAPVVVNQSAMFPSSRMSSTTKNALVFVGAGAVALGAAFLFLKKRG